MKIGSACSGYGGLDIAVEKVFGARTVWHSEVDANASKVLAHRWQVPNHGDLTTTDWSTVEPIDIFTAGWPCQPWSAAGKQLGAADERAIWPQIARAIRELRPRWVVLENVSAVVVLGELARAAGDLAEAGYDAQWTCLSASEVGAPHKRERFFIVASDTQGVRRDHGPTAYDGQANREVDAPWNDRDGDGPVALLPTPKASDASGGKHNSDGHADSLPGTVRLLPTPRTTDANGAGQHGIGGMDLRTAIALLPTPMAGDAKDARNATSGRQPGSQHHSGTTLGDVAYSSQWGKYADAIERWENVTRPAPAPTELNSKGNPRLSAAFAEWMMGLPAGWVTDVDLPRSAHLKILGNGVVPPQAEAAIRYLLDVSVVGGLSVTTQEPR